MTGMEREQLLASHVAHGGQLMVGHQTSLAQHVFNQKNREPNDVRGP